MGAFTGDGCFPAITDWYTEEGFGPVDSAGGVSFCVRGVLFGRDRVFGPALFDDASHLRKSGGLEGNQKSAAEGVFRNFHLTLPSDWIVFGGRYSAQYYFRILSDEPEVSDVFVGCGWVELCADPVWDGAGGVYDCGFDAGFGEASV